MDIFENLKNSAIVFDGAMGTMLQKKGLKTGECPEYYNLSHPDIVYEIHKSYIDAGADVIETNTFGANRIKLKSYNLSDKLPEIVKSAVQIARKAAGDKAVALSIGPIGELMEPFGKLTFDEAYSAFAEVAVEGEKAGADLALIETMSDILEAKAAILAVKENTNLKAICTMTFQEDGRTLMGTDPVTAVVSLQGLGLDAIGVNCSTGPDMMADIVKKMAEVSRIPILAQPNAGMPHLEDGKTLYDITKEQFAVETKKLLECGASIVGGCCGTTPEFIKLLKAEVHGTEKDSIVKKYTAVSSNTKTIFIGSDYPVCIIGERINPTGKKKLSAAIREGNFNLIYDEALSQEKLGASVLDVNIGVPGINEEELMPKIISQVQNIVNVPLQIDSSNVRAIEKAVRVVRGKPIINSVSAKEKSLQEVLPIVKKYGTSVIGLTISDDGLPKNADERLKNAEKIVKAALDYGIPKEDIIIDCIALTVSSEQTAAMETLRAINLVKSKLGVSTVIGLSNISYGLPERQFINTAFLAMAVSYGLDAVIVNPNDKITMDILNASMVLSSRDKRCERYINTYKKDDGTNKTPVSSVEKKTDVNASDMLYRNILEGKKADIDRLVLEILNEGVEPLSIVDNTVIPALKDVGDKYDKGIYFLPQLLNSAEVVESAFKVLKEKMPKGMGSKGKIILATVEGDIHDIGKNIVKVLLENYGYEVIDLGKDVKPSIIVDEVKRTNAKLVGLSALMTTTLNNMEKTIEVLRNIKDIKIMVGGAVLTKDYALKIGADYYGANAQEAVRIADKVFSELNTN
ncbi:MULTISPECIES: homocysteine S-methyltransferase family protein [Thermoanaerobacterium]|uniref:Methionine synthase n=2 Tax=Thermoanaerobacterium TaxID=28895 RepID=W9E8S0_9THEO|nr:MULTISPECIES: homocysteine S-methyltransferase family protein [Thermoanaerobacterium]AFK86404.1 homocysteine S-methyltransferase [Thermoanaerobacterium saccharolyticum JW/SL-YS485]ETO38227.1 homocysteine S-methyltransferase [Thermoanaerobacterium aotearoense SCUT27]